MFSYIHRYHAGGFADVHKHLTLIALILYLHKKPTPFCVLDTHAGEGIYNLNSAESQKLKEHQIGLLPLLQSKSSPPNTIQTYLNLVKSCNEGNADIVLYPGSPFIIQHLLREQDQAILIEGHPQAFSHLRENMKNNVQSHIHKRDSLEALQALIPFKEKRGLIFIDPSFEVKTEYKEMVTALTLAFARFPQGIFALWYPILAEGYHLEMLNALQKKAFTKVWYCEWTAQTPKNKRLLGSGMVILNTPWQFDSALNETFVWLNTHVFTKWQVKQGWI